MIVKRETVLWNRQKMLSPRSAPTTILFPKATGGWLILFWKISTRWPFSPSMSSASGPGSVRPPSPALPGRLDFQGYPDLQRGLYEHQKQWAPFGQLKSLLRRETPAEDAGPDSLQWTIQNNIGPAGGPVHPPAAGFLCPRPGDPASGPDHLYRRDAFLLCHGLLSGLHAPADV